jgi:hypothetical protein
MLEILEPSPTKAVAVTVPDPKSTLLLFSVAST